MKTLTSLILSVLGLVALAVACQQEPGEVEQIPPQMLTVTVSPPNQAQAYNVYVGQSLSVDAPVTLATYVVVYRNVNTGTCAWMQGLGDAGGFTNDLVVHGTGYGDSFEVPASTSSTPIWCYEQPTWKQYQIGPIRPDAGYHGKTVMLHGDGGGEFMECNGNGTPVTCYGDDGDDYLQTTLGDAELHGGPGNDRLIGQAVDNTRARFYGDDGDDCLSYLMTGRPAVYDCGPGTGDRSHGIWGNNGCEAYTSACP